MKVTHFFKKLGRLNDDDLVKLGNNVIRKIKKEYFDELLTSPKTKFTKIF